MKEVRLNTFQWLITNNYMLPNWSWARYALNDNINEYENEKTNGFFYIFNIYRIRHYYFNNSINSFILWWVNDSLFTNLAIVAIYNDKIINIDFYYVFINLDRNTLYNLLIYCVNELVLILSGGLVLGFVLLSSFDWLFLLFN